MISNEEIEKAAHEYAGTGGGTINLTSLPAFIAGVKWAIAYKPKHKQGNAFVIVSELGRNSKRMEAGDINIWITSDKAQAFELLLMREQRPVAAVVNAFVIKRCGDQFNGFDHLWNAFRKFWNEYRPEDNQAKQSKKTFKTDSFIDEQLEQR
jgi:hypothetical protein